MKTKAILLALIVAGFSASAALAEKGPGPGKGKGKKEEAAATATTEQSKGKAKGKLRCKTLLMKGAFVSAAADSFVMSVKGSNSHARALKGKDVTLTTDAKTKFRRGGKAALADFKAGDRLVVQATGCASAPAADASGAAANPAPVSFLARKVMAQGAKGDGDKEESTSTSTSTATTTTSTSTSTSTATVTTPTP